MGLAEKRALAKLRADTVPEYEKELDKITGAKIAYVVDYDSFADELEAMENLEDKGLKVLSEIFRKITFDDIGKDAVKEQIREIHISQGKEASIENFTIVKGALKLPWDWNGWSGSFFPQSVQDKIESML